MKFVIEKRIGLDYLGKNWEGCYLSFNSLSYAEVKKLAKLQGQKNLTEIGSDIVLNVLKNNFIEGLAFNGKAKTKIQASDLENLPFSVINKIIQTLVNDIEGEKNRST